MDSNARTRRHTVRSPFASTGLTCTPAVAESVRRLAAPYLTVEPGAPAPGTWEVIAGATPPAGCVPESVTAQGESTVEYLVAHHDKALFHVAPEGDSWVTQSLLRATRAIHRSAASRQGVLFLHAGLVELNGKGVALLGGSRAGKTSFIMASVLNGCGTMVCNDDVSLTADSDGVGVTGTGWPRSISVRLDTLDLLFGRGRADTIRSSLTHPANQTLLSLRESGVEPHGTALLYPWEYADLMDTRIGSATKVEAIVHLSLADSPSEAGLVPVTASQRATLLEERVLGLPNKHLNIFGHEPDPDRSQRTRGALENLPTFAFRYAFRDVRKEVDNLVAHLAGHFPSD